MWSEYWEKQSLRLRRKPEVIIETDERKKSSCDTYVFELQLTLLTGKNANFGELQWNLPKNLRLQAMQSPRTCSLATKCLLIQFDGFLVFKIWKGNKCTNWFVEDIKKGKWTRLNSIPAQAFPFPQACYKPVASQSDKYRRRIVQ